MKKILHISGGIVIGVDGGFGIAGGVLLFYKSLFRKRRQSPKNS